MTTSPFAPQETPRPDEAMEYWRALSEESRHAPLNEALFLPGKACHGCRRASAPVWSSA